MPRNYIRTTDRGYTREQITNASLEGASQTKNQFVKLQKNIYYAM